MSRELLTLGQARAIVANLSFTAALAHVAPIVEVDGGTYDLFLTVRMMVPDRDTGERISVHTVRTIRPDIDAALFLQTVIHTFETLWLHEFWEGIRFNGKLVRDPHEERKSPKQMFNP